MNEPPRAAKIQALAARLRCTEGQLYSMVIALTSATALVVGGGVPLGQAPRASAAPELGAPTLTPAATPPKVGVASSPPVETPLGPDQAPAQPVLPAVPDAVGGGAPSSVSPPAYAGGPGGPTDYLVPAPGAPAALTSDAASVFVGTDNGAGAPSRLVVFSRMGDQTRLVTVTGQPHSHAGGLSAAGMRGGDVLVTDRSRAALLQIDPRTGQQQVLAQIPDLPPCLVGITGTCQPGAQDRPPTLEGLAISRDNAYIADATQGTIWRYSFATKKLTAWYSSADFATGSGPSGLALEADGKLVFTVAQTADTATPLNGALYRLEVTRSGTAGKRTLITSFAKGSAPGPVAAGRGGNLYVGLRAAGVVVVVRPDRSVSALAGASAANISAPGGLSLANGVLYVADAGRPATASSGTVKAIPVADGPTTNP